MLMSPEQEALIGRVFETYLTEHHHGDILQLVADDNEETHCPVLVNAMTLFEANMEVGEYFNAYPNDVLAIFDEVLHRTAMKLLENASPEHDGEQSTKEQRMSHTLHARITGLPVCPELTRDTIPRSRDVGHFLSITGTVIRTSVTKVLEYERDYMCTKCRHVFTMQADFEQFYSFAQVGTCPNPNGCNANKFSCLSGGSEPAVCRDYQEIKLQEQVQRLSVGSIPRSMVVVLEDDLVDGCKSGDDVTVYGVMCQRWKPFNDGSRCDVELILKANNLEINNQQTAAALVMKDVQKEFEDFWNSYKHDPMAGRNQILSSLCPQVFGMYLIKLAVAMVLAGGVQRIDSSGTKIRGECHMLLVGDPGTGKSQFLKYAAKIIPRSVLTAGIGSTSAGLTVAALKDGGDWHLEAGALVLSDGGLCCIDEFNSIKEQDRISIHEAMEQQSISVAKAGMVCKLNTRTTILAATNPKGQYNPNEPLSVNVALASPLLSRFDLVLVLMDTRNAEWDHIISSFILEDRGLFAESSSLWAMEKMKAYFSVIKRLQPEVSDEAKTILTRYYQMQRQSDERNTARTTIRMLESLSRLAEAHARLMFRETVTIEDAVMAVSVMECSMQGGALLGNVNALLTSFPADPCQQYQTQCNILLEGLNLPLILQKEMDRLTRLKNRLDASLPTDHQKQLGDSISINKTYCHDLTSSYKGDGLDWFHSITPLRLEDDMTTPITSTQEHLQRKPDSIWSVIPAVTKQPTIQKEDSLCNIDSTPNVVLNPFETNTYASEEENQTIEKNEDIEEESRQKNKKHPEPLGCVFQKVSKNLRDRRLRELEHQLCNKEGGGGHGQKESTDKNVTNALDTTSEYHTSSPCNCPSNNLPQDIPSPAKEDKSDNAVTKTISTVLQEKMAAEVETRTDLKVALSDFVFIPKKMRSTGYYRDVGAEFQTKYKLDNRDIHTNIEGRISKQKSVSHDDSPSSHSNTKKNETQTQRQIRSEGGSRSKQSRCVSEVADSICFTSKELDKDVSRRGKLVQGKTVRVKEKDDTENLCQQERTGVDIGDETEDGFSCIPPLKPSTCTSDPGTSTLGHVTPTVAASTLAKLSRFSFTSTTEVTLKDSSPPTATELPPGEKHDQGKDTQTTSISKHKDKQIELAHSANLNMKSVNDGPANLRKRKSCEVRVGGPINPFSGSSLFGSVELSNDFLDTDWDQEVSKRAKM